MLPHIFARECKTNRQATGVDGVDEAVS